MAHLKLPLFLILVGIVFWHLVLTHIVIEQDQRVKALQAGFGG